MGSMPVELKTPGSTRAPTVSINPKTELVIRDTAAVSDSEACLMPKDGLISAGTHLAIHISIFVCVCVHLRGLDREREK